MKKSLVLSLLLCSDFDQFKLASPAGKQHYCDFTEFYENYIGYIKNHYEHNGILIHAIRSSLRDYKPEPDINNQSRYQFLEKGEKFTVRDGSRKDVSRIIKNTQTPDSDLTIIQLNNCDQKLMNLQHEYLSAKMKQEFLVS